MVGRPPPVADPNLVVSGLANLKLHRKKGERTPTPAIPLLILIAFIAIIVLLSLHLWQW